MPKIIDYPIALATLQKQGLRCLYHNSGAFGFEDAVSPAHIGWIGKSDPSIRENARAFTRQMPEPFASAMTRSAMRAWRELLPGTLWLMPKSHWSYELEFGNKSWLPEALRKVGIDPSQLIGRNNGSAIEFEQGEDRPFAQLLESMLIHLAGSDFLLAFPGRSTLCTIHHHQQLWWQSTDRMLIAALARLKDLFTPFRH